MTRIESIRQHAASRFAELGFPTTKEEEWRFTNVSPIARTQFSAAPSDLSGWEGAALDQGLFRRVSGVRLVFVNGRYSPALSFQRPAKGIRAASLSEANGDAEAHLARHAAYQNRAFVAMNTAKFGDGAWVEIPRGTIMEEPIHLVFLASGGDVPVVSFPRSLVVIGADSEVTLIESYIGQGASYFTNAVTEIVAGDHTIVDHYKLQQEDERSFHVAALQAQIGREASFSTHSISLGGGLVRNDVNAVLDEGAEAVVNGLYLASGKQHVDNHTVIDHARPHGTSRELYKGILDGGSTAVFNGKIIVRPDAQKTDAKQTNKNLLLSEDAAINTNPELQILADDVRCTHGATIGQLDQEAIFYLQSRGIGKEEARDLLTYAFARDIVERIKVAPLSALLEQVLTERLHAHRN
ncbi:MAG: Fe-S cluster assembly protein SufD [Bryobacteraceae bacterium]